MRRLARVVPVAALALLLTGCASPQAELENAVADLTDAANARDGSAVLAQANEVITLAEQQRDRLGTEQADRIVALAEAVGERAELLEPTASPTPTPEQTTEAPEPEPEPVETQEPEEPEPEPTQEPVETEEPEPEPTREPVETQEPEEPEEAPETTVPEVEITAPPADAEPTPASTQVAPAAASRTSAPAETTSSTDGSKPRKTKAPRA